MRRALHAVTFTSKLEVNNIVPMIIARDVAVIRISATNRIQIITKSINAQFSLRDYVPVFRFMSIYVNLYVSYIYKLISCFPKL